MPCLTVAGHPALGGRERLAPVTKSTVESQWRPNPPATGLAFDTSGRHASMVAGRGGVVEMLPLRCAKSGVVH
jgi:hypothetical protein